VNLKKYLRDPREIAFRLRQEAMNFALAQRPPQGRFESPSPLPGLRDPAPVIEQLRGRAFAQQVEALAAEVLAHRFPLLGLTVDTGREIAWRRDYKRQIETPADYFRRVPYLDVTRVGDHKIIWELNRHQHWVLLAQAYRLTGRREYLGEIVTEWESWLAANPFQYGINWCSALEVAFRALSWMWVYHLVGGEFTPAQRERFLLELSRHGAHLEYNLSYYFSPNTHLLGEAVALHALGTLFPMFPRSARWREIGGRVASQELEKQVLPDGAHFEQSTYYHVYAVDFFALHYILAGRPASFVPTLTKMGEYLDAVMGPARSLPLIGDDDGGRLFHPYGVHVEYGRATLSLCGLLLNRPDWVGDADTVAPLAAWWLGITKAAAAERRPAAARAFPNIGTYTFEHGDQFILFDAGGFGPGSAGHSHSDSLSLYVRQGEEELLLDPGTYEYVGEGRNAFRGSAGHNTIRIDGQDQAEPRGAFGWKGRPQVSLPHLDGDIVEAVCRYQGFTHRRKVIYERGSRLIVYDEVEGEGEHVVEQLWHAGVAVQALGGNTYRLGKQAGLTLGEGSQMEAGWRSDAYGRRLPSTVMKVTRTGSLPIRLVAELRFKHDTQNSA